MSFEDFELSHLSLAQFPSNTLAILAQTNKEHQHSSTHHREIKKGKKRMNERHQPKPSTATNTPFHLRILLQCPAKLHAQLPVLLPHRPRQLHLLPLRAPLLVQQLQQPRAVGAGLAARSRRRRHGSCCAPFAL